MIIEYIFDDVNINDNDINNCEYKNDENDNFIVNICTVNAENNISNIYHLFPLTIKCFIITSIISLYLL